MTATRRPSTRTWAERTTRSRRSRNLIAKRRLERHSVTTWTAGGEAVAGGGEAVGGGGEAVAGGDGAAGDSGPTVTCAALASLVGSGSASIAVTVPRLVRVRSAADASARARTSKARCSPGPSSASRQAACWPSIVQRCRSPPGSGRRAACRVPRRRWPVRRPCCAPRAGRPPRRPRARGRFRLVSSRVATSTVPGVNVTCAMLSSRLLSKFSANAKFVTGVPALSGASVPVIVITRSCPGANWGISQKRDRYSAGVLADRVVPAHAGPAGDRHRGVLECGGDEVARDHVHRSGPVVADTECVGHRAARGRTGGRERLGDRGVRPRVGGDGGRGAVVVGVDLGADRGRHGRSVVHPRGRRVGLVVREDRLHVDRDRRLGRRDRAQVAPRARARALRGCDRLDDQGEVEQLAELHVGGSGDAVVGHGDAVGDRAPRAGMCSAGRMDAGRSSRPSRRAGRSPVR